MRFEESSSYPREIGVSHRRKRYNIISKIEISGEGAVTEKSSGKKLNELRAAYIFREIAVRATHCSAKMKNPL